MRKGHSRENDAESMMRYQQFCRCSNGFRRNLNNCQMPRGAAGSLGSNLGCTFFGCRPISVYLSSMFSLSLFSSLSLSLSLSLSTCSTLLPFQNQFVFRAGALTQRDGASLFPSIWLVNVVWIYFGAPRKLLPLPLVVRAVPCNHFSKRWDKGEGNEAATLKLQESTQDVFLCIGRRERR